MECPSYMEPLASLAAPTRNSLATFRMMLGMVHRKLRTLAPAAEHNLDFQGSFGLGENLCRGSKV